MMDDVLVLDASDFSDGDDDNRPNNSIYNKNVPKIFDEKIRVDVDWSTKLPPRPNFLNNKLEGSGNGTTQFGTVAGTSKSKDADDANLSPQSDDDDVCSVDTDDEALFLASPVRSSGPLPTFFKSNVGGDVANPRWQLGMTWQPLVFGSPPGPLPKAVSSNCSSRSLGVFPIPDHVSPGVTERLQMIIQDMKERDDNNSSDNSLDVSLFRDGSPTDDHLKQLGLLTDVSNSMTEGRIKTGDDGRIKMADGGQTQRLRVLSSGLVLGPIGTSTSTPTSAVAKGSPFVPDHQIQMESRSATSPGCTATPDPDILMTSPPLIVHERLGVIRRSGSTDAVKQSEFHTLSSGLVLGPSQQRSNDCLSTSPVVVEHRRGTKNLDSRAPVSPSADQSGRTSPLDRLPPEPMTNGSELAPTADTIMDSISPGCFAFSLAAHRSTAVVGAGETTAPPVTSTTTTTTWGENGVVPDRPPSSAAKDVPQSRNEDGSVVVADLHPGGGFYEEIARRLALFEASMECPIEEEFVFPDSEGHDPDSLASDVSDVDIDVAYFDEKASLYYNPMEEDDDFLLYSDEDDDVDYPSGRPDADILESDIVGSVDASGACELGNPTLNEHILQECLLERDVVPSPTPPPPPPLSTAGSPAVAATAALDARFVSDDPAENQDNDSTGWLIMQQLKTDDERYRCVRERWRSLNVPDSNCILQRQTYRKRRMANTRGQSGGVKRRAAEPSHAAKRQKIQSTVTLSAVVHRRIEQLQHRYECLIHEANQRHRQNCDHATHQRDLNLASEEQARFPTNREHRMEMERRRHQLMLDHHEHMQKMSGRHFQYVENIRSDRHRDVHKLENSLGELVNFEEFYNGLKNSNNETKIFKTLTACQVVETEEVDDMFLLYDRFYSRTIP